MPLKIGNHKRKPIFQPSFFRGELFNFGGVSLYFDGLAKGENEHLAFSGCFSISAMSPWQNQRVPNTSRNIAVRPQYGWVFPKIGVPQKMDGENKWFQPLLKMDDLEGFFNPYFWETPHMSILGSTKSTAWWPVPWPVPIHGLKKLAQNNH